MSDHKQTREEWEQEFRDVQKNVLFEDEMRVFGILRRRNAGKTAGLVTKREALIFLAIFLFCIVATMSFVIWKSGM